MSKKSLLAVWRDAVRDSGLDRTAKLVAFVLSTYMNRHGDAYPSQATLAAGASLTDTAVRAPIQRIEAAGFLKVERSKGRTAHGYTAILPPTANALRRSEWATANGTTANPERDALNGERRSHESIESNTESVLAAAAALKGGAARARPFEECAD